MSSYPISLNQLLIKPKRYAESLTLATLIITLVRQNFKGVDIMKHIVAIIEDNEIGTKFEIIKIETNRYIVIYYEYFSACGWRKISEEKYPYSKDAIKYEFDIEVE